MAVIKLKTGRYAAVVNLGADVFGKRHQIRRNARTRAEAKRIEAELIRARDDGRNPQTDRLTVSAYLEAWLDQRSARVRETTIKRYREHVAHIDREIGHVILTKLAPAHILALNEALESHLTRRGVGKVHSILRTALRDAVRVDLIPRNVADLVDPPKPERFEHYVLSSDDLRRVFEAADATDYGPLVRVAAWTGLRLGELLGLAWSDIDGDRLTVRRAKTALGTIQKPKTSRSQRTLTLSPETVTLLATMPAGSENVFGDVEQREVNRAWGRIRQRAGVPRARFHDLRHAHASHLIAAGWPIPLVSARIGHSQASTTLNVYAHSLPGHDQAMAAAIDEVFR